MIAGREGCGGTAEGALLDGSCEFAGGVALIAGREGCDVVAAGATEGVVEGALLVDSCEFAGESVSRARR